VNTFAMCEAVLPSAGTGPIKLFRIRYSWQRGTRWFWASTVWGSRNGRNGALSNFTARNPHVRSAFIQGEVL